jgi:hypothetical protein
MVHPHSQCLRRTRTGSFYLERNLQSDAVQVSARGLGTEFDVSQEVEAERPNSCEATAAVQDSDG